MNLTIAADPDFEALHPKVYLELELSSMDEVSTLPNPRLDFQARTQN